MAHQDGPSKDRYTFEKGTPLGRRPRLKRAYLEGSHSQAFQASIGLAGLTNRKVLDLTEIGVETIDEIPENFPLTALQERIRQCVTSNREFISADLRLELLDVEYPIHSLILKRSPQPFRDMQGQDLMKQYHFSGQIMFFTPMER